MINLFNYLKNRIDSTGVTAYANRLPLNLDNVVAIRFITPGATEYKFNSEEVNTPLLWDLLYRSHENTLTGMQNIKEVRDSVNGIFNTAITDGYIYSCRADEVKYAFTDENQRDNFIVTLRINYKKE